MTHGHVNVLVLCPRDARLDRVVAGLSVSRRLAFVLQYGGVSKVAFAGQGARPHIEGTSLEEVSPEALFERECDTVLMLPADAVVDRNQLQDETLRIETVVQRVHRSDVTEIVRDVETAVASLGNGGSHLGPGYAVRVRDRESARVANRMLLASLVKPIDGVVSRHVNRKISVAVSNLLVRTGVHPNHLTVGIMFLGMLSGVFAACATHWWSLVVAGILFQVQSILDGCDGEIARLTYRFSLKGQWLDTIGDDVTNYAFCLGLGLGQARLYEWDALAIFAWIVLGVQIYASLLMYQRIYKMNTGDLLAIPNMVSAGPPQGRWGAAIRVIHALTKRDCFVLMTAFLAAIQLPLVAFAIIALGSFVMAPSLTLNEYRIRRSMAEDGRSA